MKDNLEKMLQNALTPSEKPDIWLDQNIINTVKRAQTETKGAEMEVTMRKSWIKKVPAVALAAVVLLSAGSLTAYAVGQYLKPEQAAEKLEDQKLKDAFQGEDAVSINESQSYGGYTATLLGMVSGKNLSKYETESDGEILSDRTYAVVAIENEDGTPMQKLDEEESSFLVSPLIQGENPARINIFTMHGGYSAFVEDGVLYRIVECDNLEAFADQSVYLCVSNTVLYDADGFHYNKKSGEITRNEEYKGLNALFQLPLDTSRADEKAAEEQLRQWKKTLDTDAKEEVEEEEPWDWDEEKVQKDAEIIPETVKTLKPDKDGNVNYKWKYRNISSTGQENIRGRFKKSNTIVVGGTCDNDGKDLVEVFTKNEDGTITAAVYREK